MNRCPDAKSFSHIKTELKAFEAFQDHFITQKNIQTTPLSSKNELSQQIIPVVSLKSPKQKLPNSSKPEFFSSIENNFQQTSLDRSANREENKAESQEISSKNQEKLKENEAFLHQSSNEIDEANNKFILALDLTEKKLPLSDSRWRDPNENEKEDSVMSPVNQISEFSDMSPKKNNRLDNKNLLDFHLQQENSTLIPFLKKFISLLKNASSLRNIAQLKANNHAILNDPLYYYHEISKKELIRKATGINKMYLIAREKVKSPLKLMKKLLHFGIFVNFLSHHHEKTILHPYQTLKILWDLLHLILMGFWFLYIPLLIVFSEVHYMNNFVVFYTSIFLLLDIFINLNTSYFKNGIIERNRKKIIKNYLQKQFLYDLLAVLPIFLEMCLDKDPNPSLSRGDRLIIHIFQLVFYSKISTMYEIMNKILEKFELQRKFQNIFSLLKVFFISLMVAHTMACIWTLLGEYSYSIHKPSWISSRDLETSPWTTKYLYAFYWASITMMTVGYGDIIPQNEYEVIFCTVTVIIGCVVYAFNINSIGQILQELNKENSAFNEKINLINQFMTRKNIHRDLQMRIREYLRYIWKEENTQNIDEEQKIIDSLSSSLKEELLLEAYGHILKRHPMFYANFTEKTLRKVVRIIKDVRLFPEEKVFNENETDDSSLFFVMKGHVELISNASSREISIKVLGVGEMFGEVCFFTGKERLFSAKSKDFTTLFSINREEFIDILRDNPDDFEKFCMIRDQIVLYENLYPLKLRCYCCKQIGHTPFKCHLIHFIPDHEKIIKKHNYGESQERNAEFPRKSKKFNAFLNKPRLLEAFDQYKEKNAQETYTMQSSEQGYYDSSESEEENKTDSSENTGKNGETLDKIQEDAVENGQDSANNININTNIDGNSLNINSSLDEIHRVSSNFIDVLNNPVDQNNPNPNNNHNFYSGLVACNPNLSNNNLPSSLNLLNVEEPPRQDAKSPSHTDIRSTKSKKNTAELIHRAPSEENNARNMQKSTRKTTNLMEKSNAFTKQKSNHNTGKPLHSQNTLNLAEIALESFETVRSYKNYFPEFNCPQVLQEFSKRKAAFSHRISRKKRLLEQRLAKYTFYLEDLRRRMPDEIKKRKRSLIKLEKFKFSGKDVETVPEFFKGGFASQVKKLDNEEEEKKKHGKKRFFTGIANNNQEKKFSDLVKNIMRSPTLKKVLKKKQRKSAFLKPK